MSKISYTLLLTALFACANASYANKTVIRPCGNIVEMEEIFFSDNNTGGPKTSVIDDNNQYVITMELPGIEPKNINVEIINNTLIVKGEKDIEHKDKDGKSIKHSKESFYRSTLLQNVADINKISAKSKNGILTIIAPKSKDNNVHKIPIQSE